MKIHHFAKKDCYAFQFADGSMSKCYSSRVELAEAYAMAVYALYDFPQVERD